MLEFAMETIKSVFRPLEQIRLAPAIGTIAVSDGEGNIYAKGDGREGFEFTVGGALGKHTITRYDETGTAADKRTFHLDCVTEITGPHAFSKLLPILRYSMTKEIEGRTVFYRGRVYTSFVNWIRDHTHVLKGMKYFHGDLKSAIELYRDSQREDGMIYDNVYKRDDLGYFEQIGRYDGFYRVAEGGEYGFCRMPIEADVEYLYVEGLYQTWKATGDDDWMRSMLDSAARALRYSMSDPYRWSEKYGLVRRTFTIDTWDYTSFVDARNTNDNPILVDLEKSEFGIMHGDNTGLAQSLGFMAEMLKASGRDDEATEYEAKAAEVLRKLDSLAWNGKFYTHHVPENTDIDRSELGGDMSQQLSLSNAYALNRPIDSDKKVSILEAYRELKTRLPEGSPGEFYTIYPPFEHFGRDGYKWEYMNGSVITIVAGELAKGAFDNGREDYGVDILQRVLKLAERHGGYLHCSYKGALLDRPETAFHTLDLFPYATGDFYRDIGAEETPDKPKRDPRMLGKKPIGPFEYDGVPFEGVKGSISLTAGQSPVEIPFGAAARSVYLVHVMSGDSPAGCVTLEYEDGTNWSKYIKEHSEVTRWYQPDHHLFYGKEKTPNLKVIWQGRCPTCERVGISAFAFDHPFPDKKIRAFKLSAAEPKGAWHVFAMTLSDQPARLAPSEISYGIPDGWGAAAVVYGLIEGLAGVKDEATRYDRVTVSPRWSAADVNEAEVYVKYPASGGYVAYRYEHDPDAGRITLKVTGSGQRRTIRAMLPDRFRNMRRTNAEEFSVLEIGGSKYFVAEFAHTGVSNMDIEYD